MSDKKMILAMRGSLRPDILAMPDDGLCRRAARRLDDFFERYANLKRGAEVKNDKAPRIVVGTVDSIGDLSETLGVSLRDLGERKDAYVLRASLDGGHPLVLCVGRGPEGASAAAWALLRELRIDSHAVTVPELDVVNNPFIAIREVTIASGVGQFTFMTPVGVQKKYYVDNWDEERVHRYIDLMDAYGFNSIQRPIFMFMRPELNAEILGGDTYEQRLDKVISWFSDEARANGQRLSLFLWGNSIFYYDPIEKGSWYRPCLCPDKLSKDRAELEAYWTGMVQLAPRIDHFITHWVDVGGCDCGKCSIETPQQIHAELLSRSRVDNPKIASTFSLWELDTKAPRWRGRGPWPGYRDESTVIESGLLPPDVGLTVTNHLCRRRDARVLFPKEAAARIAASGRPVGVWAWYLADYETALSMYYRGAILQEYFENLPSEESDILTWHSMDDNAHLLNLASLYVAARLMRSPKLKHEDLLREWASLMFGEENVEAIARVHEMIQAVRGRSMWNRPTADPEADLIVIAEAGKALRTTRLRPDWMSPLSAFISPRQLLEEYAAQLDIIEEFLRFELAVLELKRQVALGATKEQIEVARSKIHPIAFNQEFLNNQEAGISEKRLTLIDSVLSRVLERPRDLAREGVAKSWDPNSSVTVSQGLGFAAGGGEMAENNSFVVDAHSPSVITKVFRDLGEVWASDQPNPCCPKDVGIEWEQPVTIGRLVIGYLVLYSRDNDAFLPCCPAMDGYKLQCWDEQAGDWRDIAHTLDVGKPEDLRFSGQFKVEWNHRFQPVTTRRMRVLVTRMDEKCLETHLRPAIFEFHAYAPDAP